MIELSQFTLLVMIEVMIALLILSGVLAYFALTRKGRVRKAAHHLAERVKSDEPARTKRLKQMLSEHYGLADAELEQTAHGITQAEMRLFQNLINGYIDGDTVHLQQIDVDEENLVLAYQGLKPKLGAAPASAAEGGDAEEFQRLHEENERLSDELRITMDTMGRMLNEYSSMFAGGSEKPLTRNSGESAEGSQGAESSAASDVEIPELSAADFAVESALDDDPDRLLDSEAESSILDEEVSEIIDEVMEMADGISQQDKAADSGESPEQPAQASDVGESLLDELEEVKIDLPEEAPSPSNGEESEADTAQEGSLEEEWARMLEEEAAAKKKPDPK